MKKSTCEEPFKKENVPPSISSRETDESLAAQDLAEHADGHCGSGRDATPHGGQPGVSYGLCRSAARPQKNL